MTTKRGGKRSAPAATGRLDGWATEADLERLRYDKVSVEIELFNAKSAHDHQESAVQPTPK